MGDQRVAVVKLLKFRPQAYGIPGGSKIQSLKPEVRKMTNESSYSQKILVQTLKTF